VDDVHEADEASLRLLHYLARCALGERAVIALAHRSGGGEALEEMQASMISRGIGTRVELAPLGEAATRRLLAQRYPALGEDTVGRIWAVSGGLPFTALELARAAAEGRPENAAAGLPRPVQRTFQRVAMLGHELETLETGAAAATLPSRLGAIRSELDDLAGGIRGLAHRVHPAALDHLGLPAALVQLGSEFEAQGLGVRVSVATSVRSVGEPVATALYRVAQESLRNVLRHANAGSADLRLRSDADGITLEVEDGGIGFDPSAAVSRKGLGLTSLSERMKLVQGRVMVRSAPGGGTRITAWVPVRPGATRAEPA